MTTTTTKSSQKYDIHPAAELFPMMSEAEFAGLKADIDEHGQREDIIAWCGKIIDGRHRLRACTELGIEPSVADLDEHHDPIAYVLSHNLHRRHLTTSQRAMVAANVATLKHGGDRKSEEIKGQNCPLIIDDAAKQLNVSPKSVKNAKRIKDKGTPELAEMVSSGKVSVDAASKVAKKPKAEQEAIVAKGPAAVKEAAKAVPEKLQWVDVDDEIEQPAPPKSDPPKKKGCSKCDELKVELKRAENELKEIRIKYTDLMTTCGEQTTLISKLVDSKESISVVAKPSSKKPKDWIQAKEIVVGAE